MTVTPQLIDELLRFPFKQTAVTGQKRTSTPHPWLGGLVGFVVGVFCGVFVPLIVLQCVLTLSAPLTDLWSRHNPMLSMIADILWLCGAGLLWIILAFPYLQSEHRPKSARVAYLVGAVPLALAWTLFIVFLPGAGL